MFVWIYENIATIIICVILIAAVTASIATLVRDRRRGKSSCGCGCADCPMSSSCHPEKRV